MHEKFRLAPALAIIIRIRVVPIRRLHYVPVDFIEIAQLVEKVAERNHGMAVRKYELQPLFLNRLCGRY